MGEKINFKIFQIHADATSSSKNDGPREALRAVDRLMSSYCETRGSNNNPWIQIVMKSEYKILGVTLIAIYQHRSVELRLGNVEVTETNPPYKEVITVNTVIATFEVMMYIPCTSNDAGRYFTIQKLTTGTFEYGEIYIHYTSN